MTSSSRRGTGLPRRVGLPENRRLGAHSLLSPLEGGGDPRDLHRPRLGRRQLQYSRATARTIRPQHDSLRACRTPRTSCNSEIAGSDGRPHGGQQHLVGNSGCQQPSHTVCLTVSRPGAAKTNIRDAAAAKDYITGERPARLGPSRGGRQLANFQWQDLYRPVPHPSGAEPV